MLLEAKEKEVRRCDREISEASAQHDKRAYLVALGVEDWECEKRLIARLSSGQSGDDSRVQRAVTRPATPTVCNPLVPLSGSMPGRAIGQ